MTITFKFRGPRAVDFRPAGVSGGELWAKNASSLESNDGTVIDATLLNEIVANLRALSTALGTTPSADDDHTLRTAVESYVSGVLSAKASIASPEFTGIPTAPTAAPGTDTDQLSTTAFVQAAIAALIASAPGVLDTLDELAAALGDDGNFAATVTTALAGKSSLSHTHAAADIISGVIAAARLGSGTPGVGNWLRGDGAWTALAASDITSGVLAVARLGTGTADTTTYLRGDGSWTTPPAGGTDHGALTGLADDDHTQYHTDARGDARYYTQSVLDTALAGKSSTGHTHAASDIASGTVATARLGSGTADSTKFLRGDQSWAAPSGVEDARLGTETSTTLVNSSSNYKAPTGYALTGVRTGSTNENIDLIYHKPIQKQVGGSWVTVSG